MYAIKRKVFKEFSDSFSRMRKYSNEQKREVESLLRQKYEEKGRNFSFKTRQLARDSDISQYIIGRVVMGLECVVLINDHKQCCGYSFKTCF